MLHDILCVIPDPRLRFHAPRMRPAGKSAIVQFRNSASLHLGTTPRRARTGSPHSDKWSVQNERKRRSVAEHGEIMGSGLHVISDGMRGRNERTNEQGKIDYRGSKIADTVDIERKSITVMATSGSLALENGRKRKVTLTTNAKSVKKMSGNERERVRMGANRPAYDKTSRTEGSETVKRTKWNANA